ncbi:MAG: hypothetical protein ABI199_05330 [Bacteroidia bacterium]
MLGLLVYHLFLPDPITATQTIPTNVKPGDSFTVQVTVTKGSTGGFAKLQEDLPTGFTATALDSKGATFSFADHSVKFIWMSLPTDNSFVVTYQITVDASVSGQQSFGGKLSYVVDNNRQSALIASSNINVATDNAPVASNADATNATTTSTTTANNNSTNTTSSVTANPTNTTATTSSNSTTSAANITSVRVVPTGDVSGSFTVSLSLNRSNVTGFAKLEETLPIGFTATAIDKDGASFSFSDQKAKFIWLSLPSDSVLKVSYKVTVDNSISGSQSINGVFAYVQDSTKKYIIPASTVSIINTNSTPIAANTSTTNATPVDNSTNNASATNSSTSSNSTNNTSATNSGSNIVTSAPSTNTAANQITSNSTPAPDNNSVATPTNATSTNTVANIPSGSSGVSYSVQIAALHKAVQTSYFTSTNKIKENIRLEMMDGYTKYVVGNFTEYKSARDHREDVRGKGIVGPFVTAYNTGKRITVQEALMVSNQKWYK